MPTRVLVPSGVLGLGFDRDALANGVAMKPDIICIDGGSTDSGPFSLGTGTSKYSRAGCKSEWRELMIARAELQVPLVISSCGTCGSDNMVDWMFDITQELAIELKHTLKVALLYSEQSADTIVAKLDSNQYQALDPVFPLEESIVRNCTHIVALAGAEHIAQALESQADIILTGRATDTAAICALPIMRGEHVGAAWHGAKIAECGALCSTNPISGVILLDVDQQGFNVQPMASDARCTPHSVSAHMLYENSDPFLLHEPGGTLDVTQAHYEQTDERTVRVIGSQWHEAKKYTVKLEAARCTGYQSTIMAVLRDTHYVANARQWLDRLSDFLEKEINTAMRLNSGDYSLEFRLIGVDSVLGALENKAATPTEVGVLGIITANSEELTEEIAKLINPFLLHYPLTDNEALPTFAFPYSPAHSNRGALYEFCMNHVIELNSPMDAFRIETRQAGI